MQVEDDATCRSPQPLPPPEPGPAGVSSETLTEQPRPERGPRTSGRAAALQPLPLADQHLPAPRAPNVMEARRLQRLLAALPTSSPRLGRAAAVAAALVLRPRGCLGVQAARWGEGEG